MQVNINFAKNVKMAINIAYVHVPITQLKLLWLWSCNSKQLQVLSAYVLVATEAT